MTRSDPSTPVRQGLPSIVAVLLGLLLGVGAGLFFGDYCAQLKPLEDVFVGLMQMTILPYVMLSLLNSLGRLAAGQARRLLKVGLGALLLLWATSAALVVGLSGTFPDRLGRDGAHGVVVEAPAAINWVRTFVPTNVFESLASNAVPAVVVFCLFAGLALSASPQKAELLALTEGLQAVVGRMNHYVARVAPWGVFFIAANTSGTFTWSEVSRVQIYLAAYAAGAAILTLIVLPVLIAGLTPYRYREALAASQASLLIVLATGKLSLALPTLIEDTRRVLERSATRRGEVEGERRTDPGRSTSVLYPLGYSFPHAGKILSLVFVPFVAWFYGSPLSLQDSPKYLLAGIASQFAGPLAATSFLLETMHLPQDLFPLFVATGVVSGRLSDVVGVSHLAAFTMIGHARLSGWRIPLLRCGAVLSAGLAGTVVAVLALHLTTARLERMAARPGSDRSHAFPEDASFVEFVEIAPATPNPAPLRDGESVLQRVRRRGVLRVGYHDDKLPFAYRDERGRLVGFDVSMAHRLAIDLGVKLEFVPWRRSALIDQVRQDHFDIVMSGLHGTLERAELLTHTQPYVDVTMGLIVSDHRVREFASIEQIRRVDPLRVAYVEVNRDLMTGFQQLFPTAELAELPNHEAFFALPAERFDALLTSAEAGVAYARMHPHYEMVVPRGRTVRIPLIYVVAENDAAMRDFVEHWLLLRRKDGTLQSLFDHWVSGKTDARPERRWCVLRDVLHWVK